jgi:hypothetical protein
LQFVATGFANGKLSPERPNLRSSTEVLTSEAAVSSFRFAV